MDIFPTMEVRRFEEVEPASLIVADTFAGHLSLCLKVVYKPSSDAPQGFVLALDREAWKDVGKPHLIHLHKDEIVFDLGSSFVFTAEIDPAFVSLNPDAGPDANLGLVVVGEEKFFRVLGMLGGIPRRPMLLVRLPSGEVIEPHADWHSHPRAIVERWQLVPIAREEIQGTVGPAPILTWPPEEE